MQYQVDWWELHVRGGKFFVVLPSAVVKLFFQAMIDSIAQCLCRLKNAFLVSGFSASPLVQEVAVAGPNADGCVVTRAVRPDVAIGRGAVLFASTTMVLRMRKPWLTYGVGISVLHNDKDPDHARRRKKNPIFDRQGQGRIRAFLHHIVFGHDIPRGGLCLLDLTRDQRAMRFDILPSRCKDVRFPDPGAAVVLGKVTVPLDTTICFEDRGVEVQLVFDGIELPVHGFCTKTGEKIETVVLGLSQEAGQRGTA